jgi:hypothetical protein
MKPDSERACIARLQEMDAALRRMERELPDDVRQVGAEARKRVATWLSRLAAGGVELAQFNEGMREISGLMDALTSRLLLKPWDSPKPAGLKS